MQLKVVLAACLATSVLANLNTVEWPHKRAPKKHQLSHPKPQKLEKRQSSPYLTPATAPFAVNGSAIPEVGFYIGESYAGTLSIDNNTSNPNQLWFWFFPSENPAASNEITIWLNGGPGCSSLDGLLQENGPFLWQSGTYEPQPNPFSFTNLTNMVWIDQPIGTGFSPAAPGAPGNITNEIDVAADFAGFWENFMTTFGLMGRDVYITGESYAGQYIPYIASHMLDLNNTDYYNVKGIQINDPSIGPTAVVQEAPALAAMSTYQNILNLNDSFVDAIYAKAQNCGYIDFMNEALTFPPAGKFTLDVNLSTCDIWSDIVTAAIYINPCFNIYHLTDFCPFVWDELGFPSLGAGPNDYFNQSSVQAAIHAPPTDWTVCGDPTLGLETTGDMSLPSSFTALPSVIERTNNVLVGSGKLDFLLFTNGTAAALNNMTWNGAQGFSSYPNEPFFVPYNPTIGFVVQETENQPIPSVPVGLVAGGGLLGEWVTDRGLTFCTVDGAGHEIPQYVPGAAYRQLEFLLGRIGNLSQEGDFTTQMGNYAGSSPLR